MTHNLSKNRTPSRAHLGRWTAAGIVLLPAAVLMYCYCSPPVLPQNVAAVAPNAPQEADAERVHNFCGVACHAYPPPDSFPRSAWRREVKQAYDLFHASKLPFPHFPSQEGVALYYERRAPEGLPPLRSTKPARELPASLRRKDYRLPGDAGAPAVSHVNLVHLFDERRLDILVCEMRRGEVLALQSYLPKPVWRVLYSKGPDQGFNPAHAEVVDLDGDGVKDVVVANLGYTGATDAPCGSVVWLRGLGDGRFEPHTLLDGVGRVADVRAADFRGIGKLDLIVAAFGWRNIGAIHYLENHTTDSKKPRFVPRVLDDRHGAVSVPVGDLNGDGKVDFAAVISQEHEIIVAFLNEGGRFRKETLYAAPHPGYSSSSADLVDLNGDGKLDVLYTNGDTLDPPDLLKPYHSVQWLENRGAFPFVHHPLAAMYGVMSAAAADFTGKGRKDIVAVSFLSSRGFPQRKPLRLDSVLLLEQTAPGEFVQHSLETVSCDHMACAVGDIHGDGKPCLLIGSFSFNEAEEMSEAVTVWEKMDVKKAKKSE